MTPDGTQEVVKQLQRVYGEDRIVSSPWTFLHLLQHRYNLYLILFTCLVFCFPVQLLRVRPGKLGLGMLYDFFF